MFIDLNLKELYNNCTNGFVQEKKENTGGKNEAI
jgi:hypothetical protein